MNAKAILASLLVLSSIGAPALAAAKAPAGGGASNGALKPGEYACYGSGGTLLIGLGFKLSASGHYVDLDGKNPGTVAVRDGKVYFTGGILDKEVGRMLGNFHFAVGQMIECEPYS